MKRELFLQPPSFFTYLNQSGCYTLDGVKDSEMFDQLRLALQVQNHAKVVLNMRDTCTDFEIQLTTTEANASGASYSPAFQLLKRNSAGSLRLNIFGIRC